VNTFNGLDLWLWLLAYAVWRWGKKGL